MKRLLVLFMSVAAVLSAQAQDARLATNVTFSQQGDQVRIDYHLTAPAIVFLYFSQDGGRTYSGPMTKVTGDVGVVPNAGAKSILWDILSEYGPVNSSSVVFDVRTQALSASELKAEAVARKAAAKQGTSSSYSVQSGMKYRQYKRYYSTRGYHRQAEDIYSPGGAGVCSFLIPGLGQMYEGEIGRGLRFMIPNLACNIALLTELNYQNEDKDPDYSAAYILLAAGFSLNIWSICDAVVVAKKKNLYRRDIRAQYGAEMHLTPSLQYAHTSTGYQAVPGLALRVTF